MAKVKQAESESHRELLRVIGHNVKRFRATLDLSVTQLAATVGCSTTHIHNIESDTQHIPTTTRALEQIAEALGVTVLELVTPGPDDIEDGDEYRVVGLHENGDDGVDVSIVGGDGKETVVKFPLDRVPRFGSTVVARKRVTYDFVGGA